jgi:hypothetical protein
MILEAGTLIEYGYLAMDLPPQSYKPILAACEDCGKVRETKKALYRALCISCALKGHKHALGSKRSDKEKREHSDAMKGAKNPFYGKQHTEETKTVLSVANSGENGPTWRGGVSFLPYCIKFNRAYKCMIRERFGNECFLCSKNEADNGKKLDAHHVNYNKDCGCDNSKCVCVPLCRKCHAKTGTDRDYWQCLIVEMLKPFAAWEL